MNGSCQVSLSKRGGDGKPQRIIWGGYNEREVELEIVIGRFSTFLKEVYHVEIISCNCRRVRVFI